jgi:anti-sigma factor RsiW
MTGIRVPRLTCAEVVDLVTEYLEDALDPSARLGFEAHVRACPDCTAYIDQMRVTVAALASLRDDDVPE